jgi:predicted secreted protein
MGSRRFDAVVICILAVAVVNIGIGFGLAAYLARGYRNSAGRKVRDTPGESGCGASDGHSTVHVQAPEPAAHADRPAVARRGPPAQTVDELRTQVQECNEQLAGLESRVVRSESDSCGEADVR